VALYLYQKRLGTIMATKPEKEELQEQRLDARMEYGHLVTVYLAAANMMWVGFGAFFTINTLLITGLGFSYTDIAKAFPTKLLSFLHVAIPLTGVCISASAIYAAKLISNAQDRIRERATEVEKCQIVCACHPLRVCSLRDNHWKFMLSFDVEIYTCCGLHELEFPARDLSVKR
jgi:hypothetical protein